MAFDIPGLTFLEKHEKLLIVIVCVIGLLWCFSKGADVWEKHDQKKLDSLQQQLDSAKSQVAQAAQQVQQAQQAAAQTAAQATQDKAAAAAIISSMASQNAQLTKNIIDRDKATQAQQQTDLHASIPELSQRFMALVPGINPADIKVAPDASTATIGQDTAQKTVAQLELVPQLQKDKQDLQTQADNKDKELAAEEKAMDSQVKLTDAQTKLIQTQSTNIDLLNNQITKADAVCEQKVKVEHDKGRKSFLKGMKVGGILGFLAGLFVGHGGI